MKRTLSIIGQFLLFFLAYFVGSFVYHPLGIVTKLSSSADGARSLQWDGVILMVLVYLLVVIIAAARKRLASSALWSTVALLFAGVAGYLLKFGFITR